MRENGPFFVEKARFESDIVLLSKAKNLIIRQFHFLRFFGPNGASVEKERFSGNNGTELRAVPRVVQAKTKWGIGRKNV